MNLIKIWLNPSSWVLQIQIVLPLLVSLYLYRRGYKSLSTKGSFFVTPSAKWQKTSFYTGILSIFLALESPIDALSITSFSWHMVEHMTLLLITPPLILAGAPWMALYEGIPTSLRPKLARVADKFLSNSYVNKIIAFLTKPGVALGIFSIDLWLWHVPVIYDLTFTNGALHDFEHTTFLAVGMLYFSTLLDSPPVQVSLSPLKKIPYIFGGIVACWILGIILTLATAPLYTPYLYQVHSTVASVLASQELGAAMMWAPSMIPFDILFAISLQKWLANETKKDEISELEAKRALLAKEAG